MYSIIAINTNSFKANLLRYASLLVLLMCIGVAQAQVPNEPTNLVATGINTGGMIQFTAPASDGGSAITNYEYSKDNGATWITPSPANTSSPLIISSGLTNCTSYQVKIRAVNAAGSGTASLAATLVPSTSTDFGVSWTSRTSATDNQWQSVTYGNGKFVAVTPAFSGSNRVMTSPDGITWTISTSAADNNWNSVTCGNGLFVAVAFTGTGNRVMTSPDGITWTSRTSAADNFWSSVTYGNGKFVAVAQSGTGNRVMTSDDGVTWTIRTSAADNQWQSVTYGNGKFVAVASDGTGNRVMTSDDGITWTIGTSAADNQWFGVTYGNGLFVAVAGSGIGNRVMTSPDGITWTIRTSAADIAWNSVTYGNGLFVAVAGSGTGNRVMTSGYNVVADAPVISSATLGSTTTVNFTQSSSAYATAISNYQYSTDNGSSWVAVSPAATTSPITISGLSTVHSQISLRAVNSIGNSCFSNNFTLVVLPVKLSSFTAKPTPDNKVSLAWVTSTEQVNKGFRIERQAGSVNGKFEQVGFVGSKAKNGNSQNSLTYSFIDAKPAIGIASFYRLVQEDLDGKLTYSEVRMVKLNAESVSMVFPNPSNGLVNISITADGKKMNIQVTDQSGKIILKAKNITEPNYTIKIPQSGVYTIKMIYPETGEQSIQRVVVQK